MSEEELKQEAEEATVDLYGSADDVYGKEDYRNGFIDGCNKANEETLKAKELLLDLYDAIPASIMRGLGDIPQKVALFFKDKEEK